MSLIDIRPGLRAYLLADAGIAVLIDSGASAQNRYRIFPGQLPQGERRASIVYQEISSVGDHTNEGPSHLARPRYQITAWAETQDQAVALALLAKDRLDGYRGDITWGSNSPIDSVTVRGVFFDSSRDLFDADAKLYGKASDYIIWFAEA